MSLWKIAWRSIQQRALASWLTGLSMALGVALVVAVLVIYSVVDRSFQKNAEGYNMIVGAKGSPLQLVLNTVYHLSRPVENVPYGFYKEFTEGQFAAKIEKAVPYCLGDNYEGYRVVGTIPEMFEKVVDGERLPEEYARGETYRFAQGRNFKQQAFFEAVIGSLVARRTGLTEGSLFEPTHGVSDDGQGHKHDAFRVVGVLAPTGTPNDRALFVNMEGFYLLRGHAKAPPAARTPTAPSHDHEAHDHEGHDHEGHDHEGNDHEGHDHAAHDHKAHDHEAHDHEAHDHDGHDHAAHSAHDSHSHHEPLPEEQREVTAILIRTDQTDFLGAMDLHRVINEGQVAQAVYPAREISNLFEGIVGNLQKLLLALAVMVVVVAGIGIMVSIYNSMSDRRRDIAVMRSLGASRATVFNVILLESIMLSLAGGLAGFLLGHGIIGLASPVIVAETGVSIGFFEFDAYEVVLVPGLILLAVLAGYLPAMTAYRTDVARSLPAA
ncbi:MAG: FtsX-like permease family protein [Pirellulales bacterium]